MTRVVPGTAYRVATAGFWSVLCQKRFKFSCLAPELTSSLYIFSIHLKTVLYIMAPDPKKHSAKKGKARTYLCSECKTRHCSPTGAKCPKFNKSRADDEQTDQQTPGKRRRTVTSTVHSTPSGEASRLSDGDESMSQLLARLNGPPFPESEGSLASRPVTRASQAISQASTTQLLGPSTASAGARPLQDLPSRDMFTMCDQVAMLADTQARERERMERDTKNSLELILITFGQHFRYIPGGTRQDSGEINPSGEAITPQDLAMSTNQVRTLRRHRPSVNHATAVLKNLRRAQGSGGEAPALAKVATHR